MRKHHFLSMFLIVLITTMVNTIMWSMNTNDDKLMMIYMRSLGHEVLLAHGNSTSGILPIHQDENQYVIHFDTELQLVSTTLIEVVDKVVKRHNIATDYLVEMEDCDTKEIIYSYQVNKEVDLNSVACGSREQPTTCYNLRFLILDKDGQSQYASVFGSTAITSNFSFYLVLLVILASCGVGLFFYRKYSTPVAHILPIGEFTFDTHLMKLSLKKQEISLTSTESALLKLLVTSANSTIKREYLLQSVWGDKGDYIGRTLDVFVSKLRKKLMADPNIEIKNIKGVGYRLVLG